jgi:predicted nicotinamide N-methyase
LGQGIRDSPGELFRMIRDIAAIEADLLRRYPLREQEIALPGHTLRLLAAEASEDLVSAETDSDEPPFWAQIWDAGQALADYLPRGPALRGPLLELGAGVGLVGIAAALRGATVIQTDYVADALRAAAANAARCGVAGKVQPVAADWRAWPIRQRFGLVLGADIMYRAPLHASLLGALRSGLSSGGIALLADPGRPSGELFALRLLAHGWQVTDYPLRMPGHATPGRLLRAVAP